MNLLIHCGPPRSCTGLFVIFALSQYLSVHPSHSGLHYRVRVLIFGTPSLLQKILSIPSLCSKENLYLKCCDLSFCCIIIVIAFQSSTKLMCKASHLFSGKTGWMLIRRSPVLLCQMLFSLLVLLPCELRSFHSPSG